MGEYRFKLPDVGEGVVEAEIVEWRVKPGDVVKEDQPLVDVMTDKATVELPSPVGGVVTVVNGAPGDMLPVGAEIVIISTDAAAGEPDAAVAKAPEPAPVAKPEPAEPAAAEPAPVAPSPVAANGHARPAAGPPALARQTVPAAPAARSGRALASPAVRQRALDAGVDLAAVPGTGPAGRITHQDLDDFLAAGGRLMSVVGSPGAPPARARRSGAHEVKIIGLRRKIAENMARSASEIPHIAYVEEIDVTAVEALRKELNAAKRDDQPKLTFLPFLATALCRALPDFPHANAHYNRETGVLTQFAPVHLGVATATENGLMVPVLRHAEALDVWAMAGEIARLAEAAREAKASKDELSGSTITITSLGAIGGVVTTPIINYPETAIIGVNKIVERPVFDAAGRVVPRLLMNLSSSFDHRIVDGYDAASLIQRVKALLEQPATLFM